MLCFILVIFESYFGYLLGINGYWLPWSVDISLACMLFYYLGYILKKYELLEKLMSSIFIITLLLIIWIFGIRNNWIEIAIRSYPNGLWSFVTAICGSIVIFKLSSSIEKMKNYISIFLAWCGKNSLYILIAHYIENTFINYNYVILNPSIYKLVTICLKCTFCIVVAFIYVKIKERLEKKSLKKK